jgi:hypothetical protein
VPPFLPGIELSAAFYRDVVAPLVAPWPHAAARVGWGSDVLGYDTERSTDHGWGPQLLVLTDGDHVEPARRAIDAGLPGEFRGWPVRFGWDDTPVQHHVTVTTIDEWSTGTLGFVAAADLTTTQWLTTSQQSLLEATAGAVFHDDEGGLTALRQRLAWYPDQVWLWLLACQWRRIEQEEAFVGRCAEVGDELGSRIVAGRLAREIMRLWFLFERVYWPYSKWLGTAFARLPGTAAVGASIGAALVAATYGDREAALVTAYELTAARHNELCVTDAVDPRARPFHGRPFQVIGADRFVAACRARVTDPALAALPLVGSVDQVADSTDVLAYPDRAGRLEALYVR